MVSCAVAYMLLAPPCQLPQTFFGKRTVHYFFMWALFAPWFSRVCARARMSQRFHTFLFQEFGLKSWFSSGSKMRKRESATKATKNIRARVIARSVQGVLLRGLASRGCVTVSEVGVSGCAEVSGGARARMSLGLSTSGSPRVLHRNVARGPWCLVVS